jgi:hypothetical protein
MQASSSSQRKKNVRAPAWSSTCRRRAKELRAAAWGAGWRAAGASLPGGRAHGRLMAVLVQIVNTSTSTSLYSCMLY